MKNFIVYYLAFTALILFTACHSNQKKDSISEVGMDPLAAHIDSTYSPKTDFFMFANNTWLKNHPIKPTERSNGIFVTIQDTVNAAIKDICIKASQSDAPKGSNTQKIGDFFASGMDTIAIAKLGYQPLQVELDRVDSLSKLEDITEEIAHLNQIGVRPLFSFYISTDDKNSGKYAIKLRQGGLGLRQRSYYFNTDSRTKNIRAKYKEHLANMFELIDQDSLQSQNSSQTVFKIETELARVSKKLEDLRDPYDNYHKIAFKDLEENYNKIYWKDLFDAWGLKQVDSVIVGQPDFYKGLGTILKKFRVDQWKLYLKWNLLNAFADNLSPDFENEHFNFYSTILRGVMEQKPRWEIMVRETNSNLGELIGQTYVKAYLPPNTKEKLKEIGENIRTVFAIHIKSLDWMSPETKEKALLKLSKIYMKVGYPDHWKDMSSVEIHRDSYLQNILNVNTWQFNRMINKYGKPVDRSEWNMYPQTYNAYYSPSFNEIVVPACNIIVPGYEGRLPDDAILYGIIGGSTFGHEITHGFDDNGSKYDENGNLRNWWTIEDREKFEAKTKLIVEQYNNYVVLDSLHVNGEATQGENIADLGGTTMGYEAFKKTPQYQNNEMIAGLNPSQRFFLGYAFAWMMNQRDASLANRIMTDVHSPYKFRVNGVVSNLETFYKTFNVEKGDAMFRPDSIRVKIW